MGIKGRQRVERDIIEFISDIPTTTNNMKAFIALCLVAVALAEQRSTQSFTLGSTSVVDHSSDHTAGPAPAQTYRPAPQPAYQPAPQPAYQPAPQPAYQPAAPQPSYKAQPAYKEPAYPDVPANYEWAYAVQDDYAGVDFDANEARNDYNTNGQYRVVLPDGRIQTVTYTVEDAYSGYVADVQYEGEARYEEPKAYAPAPKYAPAPAYGN